MFQETNKTMRRGHLLKGAAALAGLAALGKTGIVDTAETEAAGPSPVGAWVLTEVSEGNTSIDLFAFTKDGLVIDAGAAPLKAPPKGQNTPITIGLGTWAPAAGGGVDVVFADLDVGPDGSYQGTSTVTSHVVFAADGNSFKGPFKVSVEAGGKVVYSVVGTVNATRIKAAM